MEWVRTCLDYRDQFCTSFALDLLCSLSTGLCFAKTTNLPFCKGLSHGQYWLRLGVLVTILWDLRRRWSACIAMLAWFRSAPAVNWGGEHCRNKARLSACCDTVFVVQWIR